MAVDFTFASTGWFDSSNYLVLGDQILAATQQSYTVTGQSNALSKSTYVNFDFTSGFDATPNFSFGYTIVANCGLISVTPQTFTFSRTLVPFTVDQASFALTGQTAILARSRLLAADYGSLALSGQDAGLLRQYGALAADQASFSLTGQDAALLYTRAIPADYAAFVLSGQDAGLLAGNRLAADYAQFALNGQDVTFHTGYGIAPPASTFVVSAQDGGLYKHSLVAADHATIALSGQDANLLAGYLVATDAGSFIVSGQDANVLWHHWLYADARTDNGLVGQDISFTKGYGIVPDYASYTLSGQDATGGKTRFMVLDAGNFVITGKASTLSTVEATFIPIAVAVTSSNIPVLLGKDMTVVAVKTVKPIVALQADS